MGVSYGEKLPNVENVLRNALESLALRNPAKAVRVDFQGFGASSINIIVRFWIVETDQASFLTAYSEGVKTIKAAFDQAGITIPFPIRTLDFGIKAGMILKDALPQNSIKIPNTDKT
ncbi:MAG: mechanosensitive ion channel family protein [Bernardetiaceae bacterium]|nr:mechanosensitive ion channel family protein [Bernardetiaceae bacterium]